jgi:hypothetical protein
MYSPLIILRSYERFMRFQQVIQLLLTGKHDMIRTGAFLSYIERKVD